jgi:carotenoid 1,2-hydratase
VTEGFADWDWQRATLADGSTAVIYDVRQAGGRGERLIAKRFGRDGQLRGIDAPPRRRLPGTGWGIARHLRSEAPPAGGRLLEDTPFYARSMLGCRLLGEPVHAVHETLDLRRFAAPWVQALLPFRMPRRR